MGEPLVLGAAQLIAADVSSTWSGLGAIGPLGAALAVETGNSGEKAPTPIAFAAFIRKA